MQQQDAAAFGVEPLHGALHDLVRRDSSEPVVSNDVCARLRCEKAVNGVGTREARNSEKRRDRLSITNCRFDSGDAVINLVLDKWQRPVVVCLYCMLPM